MSERLGAEAAGLFIRQAWDASKEARYQHARAAADRAVEAAEQLDDPNLLARALDPQANALRMLGDKAAALTCYTRILGLAEDPATRHRLDHPNAVWAVANAYVHWVECARWAGGIPMRRLFEVLDAAEQWLTVTGHRDWRAGVLLERAFIHHWLGETDQALAWAEEALAAARPRAPGYSKATYRFQLGDILRWAGRHVEAAAHYQAILDDPESTPYDRLAAEQGLAWCALARDELGEARRYAVAAVRLAEPMGDDISCWALDALVAVRRREGDLEGAWQAATRYLDAARRVGRHVRPLDALRVAVDVALDRGELAVAGELLGEWEEHAAARDADAGGSDFAQEAAQRRMRLQRLLPA